jgi:cysteinyl-tRNA synthetase
MDLQTRQIDIQGIGDLTIRKKGREIKLGKGEQIPFDILLKDPDNRQWPAKFDNDLEQTHDRKISETPLLNKLSAIKASFENGLSHYDPKKTTNALLEMDSMIWKAQRDLENEENISQAREILRDCIVLLGAELGASSRRLKIHLTPLVEAMLQLREQFRNEQKWSEADRIRDILQQSDILVEDTKDGFKWHLIEKDV